MSIMPRIEERTIGNIINVLNEEEKNMVTVNVMLTKKEKTHGLYKETASLSQAIKDVMKSGKNWNNMTDPQKESLEMIALKLARILNGNKDHRDHWDGVAGYAALGGDAGPLQLPNVQNDIAEALGQ